MKLLLTLALFLSSQVFADSINFQTPAYQKTIHVNGITISEVQPKLTCHFKNKKTGVDKISRKYIYAQLKSLDSDNVEIQRYKLISKRGILLERIPRFDIQSCAYVLIIIGKEKINGKSIMGDIVLIGQLRGRMGQEEINLFQDKSYVAKHLKKRLADMVLVAGKDHRGRRRIINLYD